MICRECGEDFDETEFHRRGKGRHNMCKTCASEYYGKWYKDNMKTCEICGGPRSPRSAKWCRKCYVEQHRRKQNRCADCGAEIGPTSKRCRSCAAKRTWADPNRRKRLSERKRYEWRVGIMRGHPQPESMKRYMSKIMKEKQVQVCT